MGNADLPPSSVFCFDEFRLDAARRTLHRDGIEVDLRAKCFDLLTCLARHAGQTVTKDELIGTTWPGVVVTDESLTRCISDIRQALGDRDQRIVKTVPRRGYVMATPVSSGELLPAPISAGAPEPIAVRASAGTAPAGPISTAPSGEVRQETRLASRRWLRAGVLAVVLVAAAGIGWLRFSAPADSPPALSIIVLPLVNVSGDPAQNDFAQGISEDLSTDLSRIPDSFVIARGTADTYKGRTVDVRQIGREVGVRYVVEGSVQRLGEKVRLNLRLIDAENGRELWAERMDADRSGLADLQTQVTGTVARTLHVHMVEAESERSRRLRPLNPGMQDLLWQARAAAERHTPESNGVARDLMLRAVAMDASSVSAWSLLSETYTLDLMARWVRGGMIEEWIRRAAEAAEKAYAIDPNNPDALGAMGKLMQARGRPEQALALFQRQVEINRNHAPGWFTMGYAYATLGQPDAAIAANERALRLSPRDRRVHGFHVVIAAAHLNAGRDDEAVIWAKRAIAAKPDHAVSHAWLAAAAANLGDAATARWAIEEFRRLLPGYTIGTFRAELHGQNPEFLAQRERFYRGLEKAGLAE